MKIRTGFVSNSSSSSFVLPLRIVSEEQLEQIKNHIRVAIERDLACSSWEKTREWEKAHDGEYPSCGYASPGDQWAISVSKDEVRGETTLDNFNMGVFLDAIGIDVSQVKWGDGEW